MEILLTDNFIVDEPEILEAHFEELQGYPINWDILKLFITEQMETKVFYLDSNLKKKNPGEKGIMFVWIDTGYLLNEKIPLFISLVNHTGYFCGHFIGTAKYLSDYICNTLPNHQRKKVKENYGIFCIKYNKALERRLPRENLQTEMLQTGEAAEDTLLKKNLTNKKIMDETFPKQHTEITEEIYNSLLYPSWNSIDGLDTYLKVVGRRITELIKQDKSEYFVLNNIKSAVVNTGLMDKFGNDYLILYKFHVNKPYYVASKVIQGKLDYLDEGFTREQINKKLKPISFFNEDQEQYLTATIEDFDINMGCLQHIIERSIERLPDAFKYFSTDRITVTLMNAVELGLRLQEKDKHFAKAIYSGGKISWVLPFKVNAAQDQDPELVIIICKCREFYEVKTILPYDDEMKDKITSLSLYHQWW